MGLWLFITIFIFGIDSSASVAGSLKWPDSRHRFPREARNYLAWISHVESLGSSKTTSFDELSSSEGEDGLIVDQSFVTVSQTPGAADFESIQAAIDSIPKGNEQRIVIKIAPGTYR
jgi:pectin methylesterase-like acyl-CoA thioesterase